MLLAKTRRTTTVSSEVNNTARNQPNSMFSNDNALTYTHKPVATESVLKQFCQDRVTVRN